MHFFSTVTASLLLASGAVAQTAEMAGTTSSSSTTGPMPAAGATVNVHIVTVSDPTGKKLQFSPNNIQANVGEMVQFQFQGGVSRLTFVTGSKYLIAPIEPYSHPIQLRKALHPHQQCYAEHHGLLLWLPSRRARRATTTDLYFDDQ